jgi:filamin
MEVANAGNSWAEGPGLVEGKTTRHNPFTIHAVDADGNPVPHGGDPFVVGISGPSSSPADIQDNGDGTYSVDYIVDTPGNYVIDVSLHGAPIKNSPFHVVIKPNVDPNFSYAEGPGLEGAVDNEEAHFTIFARDGYDQPRTEGGDAFEVVIDGPENVPVKLVDNGDGTYAVSYSAPVAGDYLIHVNLEGHPIKNAPYSVKVTEGIDLENTGFTTFSFTVQTRDKNKKSRNFGGDLFQVNASGPAALDVDTNDNGDGSYTASFTPSLPGQYEFVVLFNGRKLGSKPLTLSF